jgi:hypothetical protein
MVVNKNSSKSPLPAVASKARYQKHEKNGPQKKAAGRRAGQCAVCGVTLDLIEEYLEDPDTQKPDWYGQPGCQNKRKLPFLF